jgi:Holliday junction resolvase RusA-like endonuclease
MAKARRTITVTLPGYQRDREKWRREIHRTVLDAAQEARVSYRADDSVEVTVLLYLGTREHQKRFLIHDVDNRLKDILDALQGRFGRSRTTHRLIENDNSVRRVVMEKQLSPKNPNIKSGGWLTIRPYRRHRWPL